jgi:hypothetical protein
LRPGYRMNGSTIGAHGVPHEPFFLIPVGELSLALGVLFGCLWLFPCLRIRLPRRRV